MLNLSQFAHEHIDAPAPQPDRALSVAAFTQTYGGNLERIGTSEKFLTLLSILDYLGSADPVNHPMQAAVTFQDGDGYLAGAIDSDEWALLDWLNHFAELDQQHESGKLLWGIAATLFEQLRGGCDK